MAHETDELSETNRIESFSDAVFAIAITLLILEIRIPQHVAPGKLAAALIGLWPSYLAFATSFFTIAMMWVNHHRVFSLIERADEVLIAVNFLLLLAITWVPFPTALLARYLRAPDEKVAAIVYSGTFLLIAILFNLMLWYSIRRGRTSPVCDPSHPITRQYAWGPILYTAMFVVGLKSGVACLALSALLAIFFALPPRLWSRGR